MGVSQHTVETVLGRLRESETGRTAVELHTECGYSLVTVREALAFGRQMGYVAKLPGKIPAVYIHTGVDTTAPDAAKVVTIPKYIEKVVEKPFVPYVDSRAQKSLAKLVESKSKLKPENVIHHLILEYEKATDVDRMALLKSLFNIAEFFNQRDFQNVLRIEDVRIRKNSV